MLSKLYFIIISSLLFLLSTSIPPLLKLYFSENRKASSLVERGNLLPGQKPNTYTVGTPSPLTYRPSYSSFLKGFPDSPESWLRSSRPRFQKWSARWHTAAERWAVREVRHSPHSPRLNPPSPSPQRGAVQSAPLLPQKPRASFQKKVWKQESSTTVSIPFSKRQMDSPYRFSKEPALHLPAPLLMWKPIPYGLAWKLSVSYCAVV